METTTVLKHKLLNVLQSLLLLAGMAAVFATLGWLIGGASLMLWLFVASIIMFLFAPTLTPRMILSMYAGRALGLDEAPELYGLLQQIARRANLKFMPQIYYLPTQVMNALTVGQGSQAKIALTDGLLRRLSLQELAGVIAHEVSHIKNKDIWIMGLADFVSRMTNMLSLFGQIVLLFTLPFMLFLNLNISWLAVALLILAPILSAVLQRALSRTREFNADLDAVRITGDPQALASALNKLEYQTKSLLQRIIQPVRQNPDPSVLRSHPPTEERIKKLMELSETQGEILISELPSLYPLPSHYPHIHRVPRRRYFYGIWH